MWPLRQNINLVTILYQHFFYSGTWIYQYFIIRYHKILYKTRSAGDPQHKMYTVQNTFLVKCGLPRQLRLLNSYRLSWAPSASMTNFRYCSAFISQRELPAHNSLRERALPTPQEWDFRGIRSSCGITDCWAPHRLPWLIRSRDPRRHSLASQWYGREVLNMLVTVMIIHLRSVAQNVYLPAINQIPIVKVSDMLCDPSSTCVDSSPKAIDYTSRMNALLPLLALSHLSFRLLKVHCGHRRCGIKLCKRACLL